MHRTRRAPSVELARACGLYEEMYGGFTVKHFHEKLVKRHGYKGAFEIAASVDYLFAFAATTHAVASHHFDLVHEAILEDEDTRDFIAEANAPALREIAEGNVAPVYPEELPGEEEPAEE